MLLNKLKTQRMKIIIVQSIPQVLELIKKKIQEEPRALLSDIVFEGNFENTLKIIPKDQELVVITSEWFHDSKDELFKSSEKDASRLALEIKKINPKAKVYAFSSCEPKMNHIDGFFKKTQGGREIIDILKKLKLAV